MMLNLLRGRRFLGIDRRVVVGLHRVLTAPSRVTAVQRSWRTASTCTDIHVHGAPREDRFQRAKHYLAEDLHNYD